MIQGRYISIWDTLYCINFFYAKIIVSMKNSEASYSGKRMYHEKSYMKSDASHCIELWCVFWKTTFPCLVDWLAADFFNFEKQLISKVPHIYSYYGVVGKRRIPDVKVRFLVHDIFFNFISCGSAFLTIIKIDSYYNTL